MNRAEIKETAKQYMRQNKNHGGMVGVEVLFSLLYMAASAAILDLTVVTGLLSGIATFLGSAISSLTAVMNVPSTIVSYVAGSTITRYGIAAVLVAPVQIGLIRYYLRIVEVNKRPKVVSTFEPFENYGNVVRVCWSEWIRTTLLPSVVSAIAGALITVVFGASAITQIVFSYGRNLSGLGLYIFLLSCVTIACLALSVYMWYKTWAMRWILAENHDMPVDQVLAQSAQITEGHFGELFVFELSFFGWRILKGITLGLVGVFYVDPYYHMSCALLYQELKKSPVHVISVTGDDSLVDSGKLLDYLHYLDGKIQKVENKCSQNENEIDDLKVKVWSQKKTIPIPDDGKKSVVPPTEPKDIAIIGVAGMYAGAKFPLQPDHPVLVGRDKTVVQIVFTEGAEKISRRHCSIMFNSKEQKYQVIDYSSNGTYVNGSKLPTNVPVLVKRGTELALGNTKNVIGCCDAMAYAHDDQRAVHPIIPNRSIGLYFVLSFATLSLYHYWFMQQMVRDVNRICDGDGEQEIPSVGWMLLLSILTLGAYQYLWFAHIADRLYNNAQRYRVDSVHDGETLCLWMILLPGMGAAVAMALMIRDVNHMVRAYYAESIDARSRQKCPTERNSEDGRKACSVPHKKSTSRGNDLALGGLLGLAGNYKNMKIPLQVGEQLVLGRDPKQAGLIIEGQKISRVHCIVQYIGFERGYLVTDCSRNGVQINGRQIEPRIPVKVKCGSKLMLPGGEYVFQFL